MYTTLINKIETTLEKVDSVQEIYNYRTTKVDGYPAVVFTPDSMDNSFETVTENFKVYRFRIWIWVSAEVKSMEDVNNSILPNVVDDVVAQFDEDWDGGTINGHRCWVLMNSGIWDTVDSESGKAAYAEMTLSIKVITNN